MSHDSDDRAQLERSIEGWWGSVSSAVRVMGVRISTVIFLLIVAFHYSDKNRRIRRVVAEWLLRVAGAPDPVGLRMRGYDSSIWVRPFNRGDVQSVIEVFFDRTYPVPEKSTVVDAGANIGCFSVFALEEGSPEKLVALEPDPRNIALLERNTARFEDRIHICQVALWSSGGESSIEVREESNLSRLTAASNAAGKEKRRTMEVNTISPDGSGIPSPERIDYLKLDIEGAEEAVLETYIERLPAGAILACELHGAEVIERFRPMLDDRWRIIEDRSPEGLVFELEL